MKTPILPFTIISLISSSYISFSTHFRCFLLRTVLCIGPKREKERSQIICIHAFFGPNVLFTQFWDPFFWVGDKLLLLDFPCFLLRALLFIGPQRDRVRHSHYLHPYISFPYLPPPLVLTILRTFCPSQRMNSFIWSCVLFHLTVLWMRPKSDFCYAYISLIRHIFTFSSLKI